MPGVVIGHNQSIAWGMTNLAPDVSDFYLEKVTDHTYLRDGQQVPLETTTETIKVAGGNDVLLPSAGPSTARSSPTSSTRWARSAATRSSGWCLNRTRMRSRSPGRG